MRAPVKITSRHIELSDDMARRIEQRARALGRLREDIIWCNVVVAAPHRSRRRGRRFDVRVSVAVPEGVVVSDRRSDAGEVEDNLDTAVTHAFRAVRRKLSQPRRGSGACLRRQGARPWHAADRGRRRGRREPRLTWETGFEATPS